MKKNNNNIVPFFCWRNFWYKFPIRTHLSNLIAIFTISMPLIVFNTGKTLAYSEDSIIVPSSSYSTINQAIKAVPNGGTIEILPGTYYENIAIENLNKSFVLRAKERNTVNIAANGTKGIVRIVNGKPITIEGINFINGVSTYDGLAGGVTINGGQVTFVNCKFLGNQGNQPSTGGGALLVFNQSRVFIIESTFTDNTAKNFGGAIEIQDDSIVYIDDTVFTGNRVNVNYHLVTAAGGAVHIGNSTVFISDSYFEKNEAGYVGGAVYVIGTWKYPFDAYRSRLTIVNSLFEKNAAVKDKTVNFQMPTESGAVHAEDQSLLKIYNSRFIENFADIGGGVTGYRSIIEIHDSSFLKNRSKMFGGAVSVTSNDTPGDGSTNYPSAKLTIKNSYIEGYGWGTSVGESAGGIYISGDVNRMFGINGVSKQGDSNQNRAIALVENVIFRNNDVQVNDYRSHGGALMIDFGSLTLTNSLFLHNRAVFGGAVSIIQDSQAEISKCDFFQNSAKKQGGALYTAGSDIKISNSNFIENSLFEIGQNANVSFGSALFVAPMNDKNLNAKGVIEGNVFSANIGLPIYDWDNMTYPINEVVYSNNQFFTRYFGNQVYTNSNPGYCCNTVEKFNELSIIRNSSVTKKVQQPNTLLPDAQKFSTLMAAPRYILPSAEFPHQDSSTPSMVSFACNGDKIIFDGNSINTNSGTLSIFNEGTHQLTCDGITSTVEIGRKEPINGKIWILDRDTNPRIKWETNINNPLVVAINQATNLTLTSSQGEVVVPNELISLPIAMYILSEYSGKILTPPMIIIPQSSYHFIVGLNQNPEDRVILIPVINQGSSDVNYTVDVSDPNFVRVLNPTGILAGDTLVTIKVQVMAEQLGTYPLGLSINTDNEQNLSTNIVLNLVQNVFFTFLPTINR
ncbi:MAG: hypothetical protein Kow0088_17810 [Anaerolineales bacterium]